MIHVHLENSTAKAEPFWLTDALVRSACERHDDVPGGTRFTVGTDLEHIHANLAGAHVLVTSAGVITDARFARGDLARIAPQLRFIHLIDAGVEDVMPLDWLPDHVQLINNSGVHVEKAREFLLMSLLALNSRLPQIMDNQRHARWDALFTSVIRDKCLLVIGLGDLGQAAVAAGQTLNMRILGVRRSAQATPGVAHVYGPDQLEQAVALADFIVICTPLTSQTRNMISRRVLQAVKPGAALVNIGRADVLDHEALVACLESGQLSGALLDVLPQEPLPASSMLWSCPNLMINPHVGADDPNTYMRETMRLLFDNLHACARGAPLKNVVDRIRQY